MKLNIVSSLLQVLVVHSPAKLKTEFKMANVMAGRARAAAHYSVKFCKALCKGMRRQAKVDASDMVSMLIREDGWDDVDEVTHIAEPWKKYWDDISGKELKPDLVRAACEEELKVVDEMGVWELRPIAECIEVTGKKPVKVRWVDVNKGDDDTPNVRCRIVAKDSNVDKRPDLFAATPPLEYLRYSTWCPDVPRHSWEPGRRS